MSSGPMWDAYRDLQAFLQQPVRRRSLNDQDLFSFSTVDMSNGYDPGRG